MQPPSGAASAVRGVRLPAARATDAMDTGTAAVRRSSASTAVGSAVTTASPSPPASRHLAAGSASGIISLGSGRVGSVSSVASGISGTASALGPVSEGLVDADTDLWLKKHFVKPDTPPKHMSVYYKSTTPWKILYDNQTLARKMNGVFTLALCS